MTKPVFTAQLNPKPHTHTHTHTHTQTHAHGETETHKQTVNILKYNHTDTVSPCKEHANIYNVCSVTKTMHAIIFGHKAEGKISPKAFQEAHKPHFCHSHTQMPVTPTEQL